MCEFKLKICTNSDCSMEHGNEVMLCEKGKTGIICVKPNTSSGGASIVVVGTNEDGSVGIDAAYFLPSDPIMALCPQCSTTQTMNM